AMGLSEVDSDGEGNPDAYVDILPGTPVGWRLLPKMNDSIIPTEEPQLFTAQIDVYGDDVTILDTRNVFFLVPPEIIDVVVD
ncbi:MAG: VWA domain-containing protein, partial [Myxococcota bacterium]